MPRAPTNSEMDTNHVAATERMLARLSAGGPDPALANDLMLFGQFVGSWDLQMRAFDADGRAQEFVAEWHFGWVLRGHAIQDVLVTKSRAGEIVGYGTTVRTFDPVRRIWWIVWQDSLAGELSVLFARRDRNAIVLDGQWTIGRGDGTFRWTFSEITDNTFRWQAHASKDGGKTWRLGEEMSARRRESPDEKAAARQPIEGGASGAR